MASGGTSPTRRTWIVCSGTKQHCSETSIELSANLKGCSEPAKDCPYRQRSTYMSRHDLVLWIGRGFSLILFTGGSRKYCESVACWHCLRQGQRRITKRAQLSLTDCVTWRFLVGCKTTFCRQRVSQKRTLDSNQNPVMGILPILNQEASECW
jgi:hypothetical protein